MQSWCCSLHVKPSWSLGGRGITAFCVPSLRYKTPVPSLRPTARALPFVLQEAQMTPSSLMVWAFPLVTSIRQSLPLSKTAAKMCSMSAVGLGSSARTGCWSVAISLPGLKFCFMICAGSNTASPPPSSADMTRRSPSVEKATWRSLGTGIVASGAKSEMTSHSPALFWNAFLTLSVEARTRVSGPAAASRPVLEATERRVTLAGGTSSVGHWVGRILSFLGPSAPWLSALKENSCARLAEGRARSHAAMQPGGLAGVSYLCEHGGDVCAGVDGGRRGGRRGALAE